MVISFEIEEQAVGCIVFAIHEGTKLPLGAFSKTVECDILEVTKIMATEGGFTAEQKDALAFFLFKDRAVAFVTAVEQKFLQKG